MFEPANDFTLSEIKDYRSFAFTEAIGNPQHDPFFSVEDAPAWITSHGYQLFALQAGTGNTTLWDPEDVSTKELKAFRNQAGHHLAPPLQSLWLDLSELVRAPQMFRPLARALPCQILLRKSTSLVQIHDNHTEMKIQYLVPERDTEVDIRTAGLSAIATANPTAPEISVAIAIPPANRKGKKKQKPTTLKITWQERVDTIEYISHVPPTFDVPRNPTALLLDLSGTPEMLTNRQGKAIPIDRFIRAENQESWDGSSGHPKGDVNVSGFFSDVAVEIRCRKVDLTCNGIDWCQFPDRSHFAGCERYEADEEEMRKLWNHELDQNEVEAASHIGIIARFYTRVCNAKCKVSCDGVPILVRYTQNASAYGKEHFIGCSKWNPGERGNHIYFAIPANVPERDVRYVIENDGNLPPGHDLPDTKCVLTVHPRVKLQNCPYSHIINNRIVPAKMERLGCDSKLIIFVPINFSPDTAHKAIILLKKHHNHPMHPPSKPNASDQLKLRTAVTETGVLGLTVQKFLNAPSTSRIYDGKRVAEVSPAYTDTRKIRDALAAEKLREHPHGMDWKGVLHHIDNHELKLPKAERYIHTSLS
ncbi:hypothetical protein R3P38DRAFT_3182952 [Favolaschia claudopus]|uniref:Uncharacterized protein n=1 Tax=Favolaschia claudopus TaxID=2862362 RepID=A0AAW0CD18_9AGAR